MYRVVVKYADGKISEFLTKNFDYVIAAVKFTEDDDNIIFVKIHFISEVKN